MGSRSNTLLISSLLVLFLAHTSNVNAKRRACSLPGQWKKGYVTYYEDNSGGQEGSCGYRGTSLNLGHNIAALSDDLYKHGEACGACFEVRCVDDPKKCKKGARLKVTATNSGAGGTSHLDLSVPAFDEIAQRIAGIVNVEHRRIPCKRKGGIRFTFDPNGNPYAMLVTVWNVGGSGDVIEMQVKGNKERKWLPMTRNWGQKWQVNCPQLVGQKLSFRVRTSDRRSSKSLYVAPKNWQFGQTFEGKNFK